MTDTWREGPARSGDPLDECPNCHATGCVFASDFKKIGHQSVRACLACRKVSNNGKVVGDLVVTNPPEAP